ncbi:MAG: purine-nucleoside phosphorylase [Candidatus Caldatribacteriaceae bacterium]
MAQEEALLRSFYPPETCKRLREVIAQLPRKPLFSIIAGSGWKEVVSGKDLTVFSYQDINLAFRQEVEGHSGLIRVVEKDDIPFLVFEGRPHFYQGYCYLEVTLPVVFSFLGGSRAMLLTNAAGSLHRQIPPGNLCLLSDQVDFTFVPDPPMFQKRFRFSPKLQTLAREGAARRGIPLFQGTYVGVLGPSFETPAEIRMLSRFGQVVGMSTVKEAKMAAYLGLAVGGVSFVTNWGSGIASSPLSHQEVLETSRRSRPLLEEFVDVFIREVAKEWI